MLVTSVTQAVATHTAQIVQLGFTVVAILVSAGGFIWVIAKVLSSATAASAKQLAAYIINNEFTQPIAEQKEEIGKVKEDIKKLWANLDAVEKTAVTQLDLDKFGDRMDKFDERMNSLEDVSSSIKLDVNTILTKMTEAERQRDHQSSHVEELMQRERKYIESMFQQNIAQQNQQNNTVQRQVDFLEKLTQSIINSNAEMLKFYNQRKDQL